MSAYVKDLGGHSVNTSGVTTDVTSVTAAPAAGNLVVYIIGWNGTGTITGVGSVADSKGNTWTYVTQKLIASPGRAAIGMWYTLQDVGTLTTSDTVTVTFSAAGTTNDKSTFLQEYATGGGGLDVSATSGQTTTTTSLSTGTTAATAQAAEVAVAAYFFTGTEASWTQDTGYSLPTRNLATVAGNRSCASEYKDLTSTGTQQASGGSVPTATGWASVIACFKVNSGGTTFTQTLTATQAQAATLSRVVEAVRSATQGQTATLQRSVLAIRSATQAQTASLVKQAQVVKALAQAQVATLAKVASHFLTLSATQGQLAGLARAVTKKLPLATQAQAATVSTHKGGTQFLTASASVVTKPVMWMLRLLKIAAGSIVNLGTPTSASETALSMTAASVTSLGATTAASETPLTLTQATETTFDPFIPAEHQFE